MTGRRTLEVGRIGRAHGLKGEVMVTFTSNRPERSQEGARLVAGDRQLVIERARPHQGRWLVQFAGVEDRTAAEALHGVRLVAEAMPTESGELWVHELVGARVVDTTGRDRGVVVAVEANPAHDQLVLEDGTMVPVVFIVEQREGAVVVDAPPGVLDG